MYFNISSFFYNFSILQSVLTEQLLTREEQYALHLVRFHKLSNLMVTMMMTMMMKMIMTMFRLRERVVELEEELIGTQRSAGLPVRFSFF